MKKLVWAITLLIVIIISLVLIGVSDKEPVQLVSPILKQEKVLGINQWFPKIAEIDQTGAPQISAEAALFIDSKTGHALYSKNPNKRLPIASLVKVMTTLIALEHKSLDDQFLVSQRAADMDPDKMLLIAKEKLTLKELLYGIFLFSANDAAEVLAEETTGDRGEFMELMNSKAKQLGMKDTYFVNPTGLDEDYDNSHSTVYDMAILTRYLIRRFPEVVEITKTPHIILPQTETHQDYDMYSGINLLTTYPGVLGFKTGYTPEAGLTIITLAQKDGHEIIGILLGSENRRDETRNLLDYSFSQLK